MVVDTFVGGYHIPRVLFVSFNSLLHWTTFHGAPIVIPVSSYRKHAHVSYHNTFYNLLFIKAK